MGLVLRLVALLACSTSTWAQFLCPDGGRLNGDNAMDPTTVPPNTTCIFTWTNDFATSYEDIEVVATNMGPGDEIKIIGPFNHIRSDEGSPNFNFHAAMPLGDITITIDSSPNSDMVFSYLLRRAFLPNPGKTFPLSAPAAGMAQFIQTRNIQIGDLYEINTTTIVALSAAAPPTTSPYDFLNVFVYDGTGGDKVILGSLYNALSRPIVSSKNTVTLQCVLPTADTFVGTIIANDDQNIVNCSYSVTWLSSGSSPITNLTLDATNGPACLTVLNNADGTNAPYLGGNVPGFNGETLTVVDGAPGGITLASYQNANYFSLPQYYPGFARTFILDKSSLNLNLYFDAIAVNDHVPTVGRKGFFMTQNFGFVSNQQNAIFYVNSTTPFNVTFNIAKSSQAPGAYMDVYTSNSKKKIDLSNVDPSVSYSFTDTLVDIDIANGSTSHSGYYATYQITEMDKDEIWCPGGSMNLHGTLDLLIGIVPPNFNCTFTFNYDPNAFAVLSVIANNIGSGEQVSVRSMTDTVTSSSSNFNLNAAFPASQVAIYVKSGAASKMHFGYSATRKLVNPQRSNVLSVAVNNDAEFIQLKDTVNSLYEVKAQTQVALIASVPPTGDPTSLLNIFVYEGTGDQKQLVGTMYSMHNNLYTSSLNSVSFYSAQAGFVGTAVITEKLNLAGCSSYTSQWAYTQNGPSAGRIQMDASSGTACLTILNEYTPTEELSANSPYFKSWNTQGTPNPVVVTLAPLQNQSLESVLGNMGTAASFSQPQYFAGFARTIILDSGSLDISLVFSAADALDTNPCNGRTGFIMSDNYQTYVDSQDASFNLNSDQAFNFTFNIVRTNPPSRANITVYGSNDTEPVLVIDLTVNDLQRIYSVVDTVVDFQLNGGEGDANLGSFITYSISAATNQATTFTTPGSDGSTGSYSSTVSSHPSGSTPNDESITSTTLQTTTRSATRITGVLVLFAAALFT